MLKLLSQAFSQGNLYRVDSLLSQGHPSIYAQLAVFTLLFIAAYLYPKTKRILSKWQWRNVSLLPMIFFGGCILLLLGWGNALIDFYYIDIRDAGENFMHRHFS